MGSNSKVIQETKKWWKRLAWLCLLFLVQLLYIPINRTVTGGVVPETLLDPMIPVWPIWAVPYLLSLAWWTGCFIWAAVKMDFQLYRAFVAAALFTALTSYALYIVYPTYVIRPAVEGSGWQHELLRTIYAQDRLNNAFPSGHTYTTMLITFFWWVWQPRLRWLWATIAVIVILSTLFTGQHNLLDPIGGIVWAWVGYRFGLWWVERRPEG